MALNETTITYGDNSIPSLYQYDYGQVIIFDGFDLPETFEVHFATGTGSASKTAIGQADTVAIPDEFLMTSGKLRGWIFLHEGEEDGETEYDFIINVLHRAAPTDTMPTPVQHDIIMNLIGEMETAVEEAGQSAEEAKEAAESVPADIVRYDTEQTLTDSEKSQARTNIGAADASYEVRNLKDGSANQSIRQTSSAQESGSYTIGEYASSFGRNTKASGQYSHSEGFLATASGQTSHAEGAETTASGQSSHAEGSSTTASGSSSHAENNQTTASGSSAHSEGIRTVASGGASHSEGISTTASGVGAHTHGEGTIANHRGQTAAGRFNIADPSDDAETEIGTYVEIIGNGTDASNRSNARTLDWNGNETLAGKLTVGAQAVNANDVPTLGQVQALINALDGSEVEY